MEDTGTNRKGKHRLRRRLFILILLFPVLAIGLQYIRIQGFKKSLIALVEIQTKGAYVLSIRATDIQYLRRSFSLNDIVISKKDPGDSLGVLEVKIPQLTVTMGSLFSMLISEQFNIQELSITEPIAKIGLKEKKQRKKNNLGEHVNVAHQIAQFYPAVTSILSEFDIKLFHIDRAGIALNRSQSLIEIRLLDLLVLDWNMRDLSDEAEFRLSLGQQSIDLARSEFSFGSIVYDYQINELHVIDYKFIQKDSLLRAVINIEGASLQISNLDYETLVTDEHYILEQRFVN